MLNPTICFARFFFFAKVNWQSIITYATIKTFIQWEKLEWIHNQLFSNPIYIVAPLVTFLVGFLSYFNSNSVLFGWKKWDHSFQVLLTNRNYPPALNKVWPNNWKTYHSNWNCIKQGKTVLKFILLPHTHTKSNLKGPLEFLLYIFFSNYIICLL